MHMYNLQQKWHVFLLKKIFSFFYKKFFHLFQPTKQTMKFHRTRIIGISINETHFYQSCQCMPLNILEFPIQFFKQNNTLLQPPHLSTHHKDKQLCSKPMIFKKNAETIDVYVLDIFVIPKLLLFYQYLI